MRRVFIKGTPPADWVAEAEAITDQLRAASDENERAEIIEKNEKHWRDNRIRNWLLAQFNNKCWYSEAQDSVSAYHVDHYRPKGRVKDLNGSTGEGYWWLAFEWNNYRICGQLINVKKLDVFPIVEGVRAKVGDPVSLQLEAPLVIDPLTDQTRLISYEKDEDGCRAVPAAGIRRSEEYRAEKTIEVLGLNIRDRLNQKRAGVWDQCLMAIREYNVEAPQSIQIALQRVALDKLKQMIEYETEFSSVSEACIRKNAPDPLIASVFESVPNHNP